MTELTGARKKHLRGLAHHLKPVVQIGKNGLTEPVLASIEQALDDHELVKVRLADPQGRKKELAEEIAERSGSGQVGLVGNVVTLYRRQPDPEKRRVELP
ncbi:MAG TPA: ribosome assembly RNA-binding protein YhbY [Thermoanaerobaculia bacterium]